MSRHYDTNALQKISPYDTSELKIKKGSEIIIQMYASSGIDNESTLSFTDSEGTEYTQHGTNGNLISIKFKLDSNSTLNMLEDIQDSENNFYSWKIKLSPTGENNE